MKHIALLFLLAVAVLIFSSNTADKTTRTITGIVRSAVDEQPLEGVNISIKGSSFSSGTQPDGIYYIPVKQTDSVLVFALDGYHTQELKLLSSKNEYNIVLTAK
ncbi:MAG: carboxypeptidase-like regulatory domain-containing protein [Chitinophagaceae bacterium]|nr:carboxypeptidase-like regulatory domain-containing protein [Chitinophagaceae bacterium]